jgi:hypothetical protein
MATSCEQIPRRVLSLKGRRARADETGIVRLTRNRTALMMVIPKPFVRLLEWQPGHRILVSLRGKHLFLQSVEAELMKAAAPDTETEATHDDTVR